MIRIDELVAGRLWLLLLVQGTACLAVGLAFSYGLRHRPARAHQVLLTALLASVLMPTLYLAAGYYGLGLLASKPVVPCSTPALGGVLSPAEGGGATDIRLLPDLPTSEAAAEPTLPEMEPVGAIPTPPATAVDMPWSVIALLGWGAITAVLLLRLLLRFALGLRLLRVGQPLDSEHLRRAIDGARNRLGVIQPVGIRCSERVQSPIIWCWGRQPVLLMQTAASNGPKGTDWAGVFCHELAHWRRRDHLTGLFAELLAAMLPWHPLLWWARSRLLKLSEQACDDWVLATGQNGVDYAEVLLGLAAERQMAFLPTVIGKEKTMHMRIRRIIKDSGSDPRLGTGWALAVGALALCTTVGVAVAQRRPAGPEPMDPPPAKVFQERREIEVRESPEADQQRIATKRVLGRLMKQADEKKEMLAKGNELPEEERLAQQIELKLLVEQIEQLKNRLEAPGRQPAKIAPKKTGEPDVEAEFDSLKQGRDGLSQRAQKLERAIDEAGRNGQDREVRELKSQLEQVHAQMADMKQWEALKRAQTDDLKRKKLDELKRAQAEVRRETMVRKPAAEEQDREELLQNARLRAEKLARALKENPDMDPKEASDLRGLLELIRAEISALEQEPRGLDGKKDSPGAAPKREYRILKEDVKIEKKAPDGPSRVVKGPADGPRLEARVYVLEHISPERMQAMVEALIGKPGTVTLYANGRKATVVTTAENHYRIERIIRIIDVPAEAYKADAGKDGSREMRIITLKYFNPNRMQNILAALLGQSSLMGNMGGVVGQTGSVGLGGGARSLVVETTSAHMKQVESIVRELDTPAAGRIWAAEVEELRNQMRWLTEQMQQIQSRLDWMAEQEEPGQADEPIDRPQEHKAEY